MYGCWCRMSIMLRASTSDEWCQASGEQSQLEIATSSQHCCCMEHTGCTTLTQQAQHLWVAPHITVSVWLEATTLKQEQVCPCDRLPNRLTQHDSIRHQVSTYIKAKQVSLLVDWLPLKQHKASNTGMLQQHNKVTQVLSTVKNVVCSQLHAAYAVSLSSKLRAHEYTYITWSSWLKCTRGVLLKCWLASLCKFVVTAHTTCMAKHW